MSIFTRVVADTNVLVSQLILPRSVPAQAMRKAELEGCLLFSEATMYELADVLARSKFDPYVTRENRKSFIQRFGQIAQLVPIIQLIRECRDPKDDKFLEAALNGSADVIITGDEDLLTMHPWRGVAVMSPSGYLTR